MEGTNFRSRGLTVRPKYRLQPVEEVPKLVQNNRDMLAATPLPVDFIMRSYVDHNRRDLHPNDYNKASSSYYNPTIENVENPNDDQMAYRLSNNGRYIMKGISASGQPPKTFNTLGRMGYPSDLSCEFLN